MVAKSTGGANILEVLIRIARKRRVVPVVEVVQSATVRKITGFAAASHNPGIAIQIAVEVAPVVLSEADRYYRHAMDRIERRRSGEIPGWELSLADYEGYKRDIEQVTQRMREQAAKEKG